VLKTVKNRREVYETFTGNLEENICFKKSSNTRQCLLYRVPNNWENSIRRNKIREK